MPRRYNQKQFNQTIFSKYKANVYTINFYF